MRGPPRNIERIRGMVAAYLAGRTLRDIGDQFGVSAQRVSAILQREGVETRPSGRPRKINEGRE